MMKRKWKAVKRTESELILTNSILWENLKDITTDLRNDNLRVYRDIVENDPSVVYIYDTMFENLYSGSIGDKSFERVRNKEDERAIIVELTWNR